MISTLPVVETFHSIQGEGVHVGKSAFFIRLASCNVACPWCDTKESWSADIHPQESIQQLAQKVTQAKNKGAGFVVLTGGEPLHHNLDPLCDAIRRITTLQPNEQLPIHLETSGVNQISGSPSWITLSPKRHAPPKCSVLSKCQEIKVVIHEKDDLLFAEDMAEKAIKTKQSSTYHSKNLHEPLLFLQPGWRNKEGQQLAIEYVKRNPQWRLSMQIHKWLQIL